MLYIKLNELIIFKKTEQSQNTDQSNIIKLYISLQW